ncbi:MAG: tRNA (guanosine(37)-N1)-methyltransferase TrmD [Thermosulfidibacteraceae bacterium]
MRFWVITIFPEIVYASMISVLRKAIDRGLIDVKAINPRDFTHDRHRTVDDEPYGGGSGMVMKVEPIVSAINYVKERDPETRVILLTPRGKVFNQNIAKEYSKLPSLTFICGRYEGIDDRVSYFVDDEVSIGDFVLSGGEYAFLVIFDAVARLIPGVVGDADSIAEESFSDGLLEYPQYTRPDYFMGYGVPEVLRSGNHERIRRWRRFMRLKITFERRPDLLKNAKLTEEDRLFLEAVIRGRGYVY